MSTNTRASDFFVAGGTLRPDAPSYVKRPADDELFHLASAGKFCYVLTPRQMGKSSLMIRIAHRLQEQGISTAIIDLTSIGTDVTVAQWYLSLLTQLKRRLRLSVDPVVWWQDRAPLGYVQRFTDFLRDVILTEIEERVVIFIDEIDITLNFDFRDDFFAAIRAMYNARADDPESDRLTFVLLGVASPPDLIKDRARTPFNIGQGITLQEFSRADAAVLQAGLETLYPVQGEAILARIYHWTNGHPYLTQKLCLKVAETGDGHWTDERVDELVEQLFLSEDARKETNLQFIRDRIGKSRERAGMLRVYRRVWAGKQVQDEERSVVKSQLKLTGLVKATSDGLLMVRNRIYERVFDDRWVKRNLPMLPMQRLAVVATVVAAMALIVAAALIYRQQTLPDEIKAELYRDNFLSATSPEVRINNLAGLFGLDGYEDEARDLFFGLDAGRRLALFEELDNPQQVGRDTLVVVEGTYQDHRLENSAEGNQLLRAMAEVLHQLEGEDVPGARARAIEIDYWVEGCTRADGGDFATAVNQYTLALGLNEENAAVLLHRGQAYAALGKHDDALSDLQEVVRLDRTREVAVRLVIDRDPELLNHLQLHHQEYDIVAAWFPTPTPRAAPPLSTVHFFDDFDNDRTRLNWSGGAGGTAQSVNNRLTVHAEPWVQVPRHWKTCVIGGPDLDETYVCQECTVQVEIEIPSTEIPQGAGIVFGLNSAGEFYEFVVGGRHGSYNTWSIVKGNPNASYLTFVQDYETWTQLPPVSGSFRLRVDLYLRTSKLHESRGVAYFYVNEARIGIRSLPNYTGGRVGVVTVSPPSQGGTVLFDNFLVANVPIVDETATPESPTADASLHYTRTRPTDGMVMVYVHGGEFEMGSDASAPYAMDDEFPQHTVTIDDFWIDQTEVTNAQYALCVAEGVCEEPLYADDTRYNSDDYPVVGVSWHDAMAYCEWAGVRLPTEAEWEYAARGPQSFIYPWGDDFDCTRGNFDDETQLNNYTVPGGKGCDGYVRTAPVGSFPTGASWCRTLDMSGNVWEWVADWYGDYHASEQKNPTGPGTGHYKVLRGGSWYGAQGYVRTVHRLFYAPHARDHQNVGFRCVALPPPIGE